MSLPRIIEYILSLQAPGGGRLAHIGTTQMIAWFLPNFVFNYESGPLEGTYALIWFQANFGPSMVPEAFTITGQQYGARLQSGEVTTLAIGHTFDWLIVVTAAEPYRGQIRNTTPLNQYFESLTTFVEVPSEEYLRLIIQHLQKLTTTKMEELASEGNRLLSIIARAYQPRRA